MSLPDNMSNQPALIRANSNQPAPIRANSNQPALIRANSNQPALIRANSNQPALIKTTWVNCVATGTLVRVGPEVYNQCVKRTAEEKVAADVTKKRKLSRKTENENKKTIKEKNEEETACKANHAIATENIAAKDAGILAHESMMRHMRELRLEKLEKLQEKIKAKKEVKKEKDEEEAACKAKHAFATGNIAAKDAGILTHESMMRLPTWN